jgi:hypothetical protein
MISPAPDAPAPCARAWEAALPLALLAGRCWVGRPGPAPYLDWIVVLGVYWILYVFLPGARARTFLSTAALLVLLAQYLCRTIPLMVETLQFNL